MIGNRVYELAERFMTLPREPMCCNMRSTLNAYGPNLTTQYLDQLTDLIYLRSFEYGVQHPRFSKPTIKRFLKKAIRDFRLDKGNLAR